MVSFEISNLTPGCLFSRGAYFAGGVSGQLVVAASEIKKLS